MKLYAVFLKDHARNPARDMILVKDGFSWPAFFFTVIWALCKRMWWIAAALFAVIGLVAWTLEAVETPGSISQIMILAVCATIGMAGNDIRRWHLANLGYSEVAVIGAKNIDDAERRFLNEADAGRDGIYP